MICHATECCLINRLVAAHDHFSTYQWLLIKISRTEGFTCGINSLYMGDYGMAGLKLPKLWFDHCWPLKWPKRWRLIIISRTDTKAMQNNYVKCADNESTSSEHPRRCKVLSRLVLIGLIGVFNNNFAHEIATSAKMQHTRLWGSCGRHNSTPASSVMDFIFRCSDGSHVSVDTVHPSLLRYSPFSSPRWYHHHHHHHHL